MTVKESAKQILISGDELREILIEETVNITATKFNNVTAGFVTTMVAATIHDNVIKRLFHAGGEE